VTIHQVLTKYWGYTSFRPVQEEIITSVMEGKDTLALLPTGGGKSICFQVPALAQDGICIVISPLIALMKDQVDNLQKKGISAIAITSAMYKREIDIALDNCIYGQVKFLYLSPERLRSDIVQARIKKMNVSLIAVDEAHCISQWGYDFRPSYLEIALLRDIHPKVPVLALTATATTEVVTDIQEKLKFKKENVLQRSFERRNLAYVVVKEEDKYSRLMKVVQNVGGTGVVYVRNRRKTQDTSELLRQSGIKSDFYHAGLPPAHRSQRQEAWIKNRTQVIVSTNAFGMGIDKPDVRFVVHLDLPDSLEAYFQEAGRAGRDEKKAYAVLLYTDADVQDLQQNVELSFPSLDEIRQTYQALANYYQLATGSGGDASYDFDITLFCQKYNLQPVTVFNSIKFLEKEGYLLATEALYQPSRVHFTVSKEELYKFQVANVTYDPFIKLLLRSYGGMFDNYVKISESEIANRGNIDRSRVIDLLQKLQRSEILSYIPQTNLPQIVFTQPRVDAKTLHISKQHLEERKAIAKKRMEWMIDYVTSRHRCRSQSLLAYFGETETHRCGICDVCLERNKLDLTDLDFDSISRQVQLLLVREPMQLEKLVGSIQGYKEDRAIKVIRWLLDNGKLEYDEEQKVCWK
jgi:ATP-dependent DNA helicase RecQ